MDKRPPGFFLRGTGDPAVEESIQRADVCTGPARTFCIQHRAQLVRDFVGEADVGDAERVSSVPANDPRLLDERVGRQVESGVGSRVVHWTERSEDLHGGVGRQGHEVLDGTEGPHVLAVLAGHREGAAPWHTVNEALRSELLERPTDGLAAQSETLDQLRFGG